MSMRTQVRRWSLVTGGVLVLMTVAYRPASGQVKALPQPPAGVSVERGKYLVTAQDCNGCHTPFRNGEPDMTRMLSGHPAAAGASRPATPMPPGWTAISPTNTAWT